MTLGFRMIPDMAMTTTAGGRELTLDYLRIPDLKDYQVFWPTAPLQR
jgi:hypothetical protein